MNAVIIFSKIPIPGNVKTRLIGRISAEEAASFARCMLLDLFEKFRSTKDYAVFVAYAPLGKLSLLIDDIPEHFELFPQFGEDMGTKMYNAIEHVKKLDYKKIILVGSDIPGLNLEHIEIAFNELDNNDIVINPTIDGGYYLIGTKSDVDIAALLSEDVNWSSESVFTNTIKLARANKIRIATGETLIDVDTIDDLYSIGDKIGVSNRTCSFIKRIISEIDEKIQFKGTDG